jgi:16S rRNA (guanine(1405)-N(7))-methyltransferase
MIILTPKETEQMISNLLSIKKYRGLDLPRETIRDLIHQCQSIARDSREAEKQVRKKLHNIVAPYLEDLDYATVIDQVNSISSENTSAMKEICRGVLEQHASTRERMPIMEAFYQQIFQITGSPGSILDLACGLNPFTLPWMALPSTTTYDAYDLHQPRIDLLNQFFARIDRPYRAEKRDVLVNPPINQADVAFFFKEAHRFEQRQHGCNRNFWQSLNVKYLIVSLPTMNMKGSHSFISGQRILMEQTLKGLPWEVHEVLFDSEILFCIKK